jgi:hypothetical protein
MAVAFWVSQPDCTALRALNYSPAVESFRKKAVTKKCYRLGSLLSSMGPAYGSVFTRLDCDRQHGVELLAQSDMFAAEPHGRVIRRDCMPRPDDHCIRKWQVLIAGAGTLGATELFGRAVIADSRIAGKYVGPHAMALTFREPSSSLSLYAYAFLLTATGISCVRATSYGTKVLGLRSDLLSNVPIPLPADDVRDRVAALIRYCVSERERFAEEIRAARFPVLGLPEVKEALLMCENRGARCLYWRGPLPTLSAWNYASTSGALEFLQRKWPGRLSDVVAPCNMFYGPRSARVPCESPYGVEFQSQRDVFMMRPVTRRIVHPGCPDRLLFVPKSALLVGGQGQLEEGNLFGQVELAAFDIGNPGITEAIFRLIPREDEFGVLYAYLSTEIGLAFLRNTAVGTSVPKINPTLIEQIPIPSFIDEMDADITAHVREAVSARRNANTAEVEAIRIVNEEVLPEWLA